MCNVAEVADAAEVIVNGYAFTKFEENIKVLNLKRPDKKVQNKHSIFVLYFFHIFWYTVIRKKDTIHNRNRKDLRLWISSLFPNTAPPAINPRRSKHWWMVSKKATNARRC